VTYFASRVDAGKRLAETLKKNFVGTDGVVLAIPRGGVVVGYEIAQALNLPLDVIVPRKLGAPYNPELAIGAVAEDGSTVLDSSLVAYLDVSQDYLNGEIQRQKKEIERRQTAYRQGMLARQIKGKDVIVVDDGIATGSTMKAALASVKNKGAKSITVAIPVGPPSTIQELKKLADRVICLYTPEYFQAIGQFYQDFSQTSDEEVIELIKQCKRNALKQERK
jgi:putative phosphoribosyl transferase